MLYNPHIETFIAVADTGSFSKAAKTLFISPQAVIKQMNLLESSLQLQLLIRSPQGIQLTAAGQSLYKDAQYILQYSRDAIVRAETADSYDVEILRVGTSILTPHHYITNQWHQVADSHPNLQLQLVSFENNAETSREILSNFGHHIDMVAGIYSEDFLKRTACRATFLKELPFQISCAQSNPLAEKDILTWEDLENRTIWSVYRGWSSVIDSILDTIAAEHPSIQMKEFSGFDMRVFNHCANSDDLILIVDQWSDVHPLLKTIDVEWDFKINLGILHAPNPSDTVQQVLHIFEKHNR